MSVGASHQDARTRETTLPGFGCRLGKIPRRGNLFLQMHPPVEWGDRKDR